MGKTAKGRRSSSSQVGTVMRNGRREGANRCRARGEVKCRTVPEGSRAHPSSCIFPRPILFSSGPASTHTPASALMTNARAELWARHEINVEFIKERSCAVMIRVNFVIFFLRTKVSLYTRIHHSNEFLIPSYLSRAPRSRATATGSFCDFFLRRTKAALLSSQKIIETMRPKRFASHLIHRVILFAFVFPPFAGRFSSSAFSACSSSASAPEGAICIIVG